VRWSNLSTDVEERARLLIGTQQGRRQRPHLTVGSRLLGPGGSSEPPEHDADYRRGYLCGVIRGDGTLARYTYPRPGRSSSDVYRFRLALADADALERATQFLKLNAVDTIGFEFSVTTEWHRSLGAIRTQSRDGFERISELIAWPLRPTLSWAKGFLGGIFDAEGSHSGGILRIANTDEELISRIVACIHRLGLACAVERAAGRVKTVRVTGGLAARMRFLLSVDPAVTRKRSIQGAALKVDAPLKVRSIESLERVMRMYDITTGTGDFIANGVISHNCFARPTHTYLDFDAGRDFEREIVVKVNAPERLRVELARRSWQGEHVALGTNTDPYQWVEGRYKLMPAPRCRSGGAADARHQRRARAGGADPRAGRASRRSVRHGNRAAPARRGARAVLRLAQRASARPRGPLQQSL
jgi:hypothetical protein